MGQQNSRESQGTQRTRYLDSDDERKLLKSSGSDAHRDEPDFAFSSQVPASAERHSPFDLYDVPQFKYEAPSSPDANANVKVPYPTAFLAATVDVPNPPSDTTSHHDVSTRSTGPKKKRRSKKHSNTIGPATESNHSPPPIDVDTSTDSVQMHGMAGELDDDNNDIPQVQGDFDMSEAPASSDLLSEKERRRREKREKKAQRKAAKQASLHSGAGDNSLPARQIDPLDIHESAISAIPDDSLIPDSNARADVTIDHIPGDSMDVPVASSKKRRLSGLGSAKKSKKQKRDRGSGRASLQLASDGADYTGEDASQSEVVSENPSHQSADGQTRSSQPSRNTHDSFSNLVESLYKGRKSTTGLEVDRHDESDMNNDEQDSSSNRIAMDHEPQRSSSSSSQSIAGGDDAGMDSAGSPNIPPADEMDMDDTNTTEKADEDSNNNSPRENDSNSQAALPSDLDNSTDNSVLANGVPENQVEVPSSFPYRPNRSSKADSSTAEHSKSSTSQKQKRVAKAPYYDRNTGDDNPDIASEFTSPSAIAAPRRANTEQESKKDNIIAGSSSTTSNRKQRKISTMLKTNDEENSDSEPSTSRTSHSAKKTPQRSAGWSGEKKTGAFTDAEIHDISQAVERWREDHQMTQFNLNNLIQSHPKQARSRDMWDHIAATCPDRPRQKVINLCRRKFHNFVARGTWTEEQHEELTQLVSLHGEKHSVIGKIINRHPEDVRDRIRNYVRCGESRRTNAWDHAEEDKLTGIVLEAIEAIENMRREERKARKHGSRPAEDESPVEDLVDWKVVSERMGTRGRLQCITKWKRIKYRAHNGSGPVDGEDPIVEEIIYNARKTALAMSHKNRYRIVKAIRSSDANADSRIPWARLRGEERWTRATLMVVWNRLKQSIPDWKIMTTPEVVHQLVKEYQDSQTLDFPPDADLDLDGEYDEIGEKINRIIKSRDAPKTPRFVGSEDDDNSKSDDDDDDVMEDAPPAERGSSVDLGLVTNTNGNSSKYGELEIEDSEPEVKSGQSSRARDSHIDLESDERDSSVEASSVSESRAQKAGRSSQSKARGRPKFTPQRFKKAGRKSLLSSSGKRTTGSSRRNQTYDEIEEVSSDTNASEVESIPAH